MPYVYILAENEEDGIQPTWAATIDRGKVVPLFVSKWPGLDAPYEHPSGTVDAVARLKALLVEPDEVLATMEGGYQFMPGWGGPLFYVLPLL